MLVLRYSQCREKRTRINDRACLKIEMPTRAVAIIAIPNYKLLCTLVMYLILLYKILQIK